MKHLNWKTSIRPSSGKLFLNVADHADRVVIGPWWLCAHRFLVHRLLRIGRGYGDFYNPAFTTTQISKFREVTDIVLNSALNDSCIVVKLSGVVQRDIKDVCQSSLISRPDSNPLPLKWMAIHSACKYIYMCLFRVSLT